MSTELKTIDQSSKTAAKQSWLRPHYNVSENEDSYAVRVDLPGVSKDQVELSLEDDILTVNGSRSEVVPQGWRPLRRELSTGDYRLSLRINVPVDSGQISASVENGVLELALPKAEELKARKIEIS